MTDTSTYKTANCTATATETEDCEQSEKTTPKCSYWVRDDKREFLTDPDGEIVNLARLTAYAEHGEEIYDAQVHHEIPKLKINAPRFLDALPGEKHTQFHQQGPDPVEVEGFPVLRTGL